MIKLGKYASDDYAKDGIDEALAGEDPSGRNRGVRTRLFEILEENKEVFSTHRYDIGLLQMNYPAMWTETLWCFLEAQTILNQSTKLTEIHGRKLLT